MNKEIIYCGQCKYGGEWLAGVYHELVGWCQLEGNRQRIVYTSYCELGEKDNKETIEINHKGERSE